MPLTPLSPFLALPCPSPAGVCKKDSAGQPLSVIVMISDSCPECETHHIDVQSMVFAKASGAVVAGFKEGRN